MYFRIAVIGMTVGNEGASYGAGHTRAAFSAALRAI